MLRHAVLQEEPSITRLVQTYGDASKIEALVSEETGRIRLASDILHLPRRREVSIRLSVAQETDRLTVLLRTALAQRNAVCDALPSSSSLSARTKVQAVFLNDYFARTALSETSRGALADCVFQFFPDALFTLPFGHFLYMLAEAMC